MSADSVQAGLDFTTVRFLAVIAERDAARGMVVELEGETNDLTTRVSTALAAVKGLHCTCWDFDKLELERDRCEKCRAVEALTLVPEPPDYDHNADWEPPDFLLAPQPLDDRNSR